MHTNELNVFDQTAQESFFHPMEKDGYSFAKEFWEAEKEECEFIDGSVLADMRYKELLNIETLPTEFDIQQKSGVWDTLQALPNYDTLFPNAQSQK